MAGKSYNVVLNAEMCPKMRPVGVTKKGKNESNFYESKWLLDQTTHLDMAPWNFLCMRGDVRELVIHVKSHENRHLPLTSRMACTTACTTSRDKLQCPNINLFKRKDNERCWTSSFVYFPTWAGEPISGVSLLAGTEVTGIEIGVSADCVRVTASIVRCTLVSICVNKECKTKCNWA